MGDSKLNSSSGMENMLKENKLAAVRKAPSSGLLHSLLSSKSARMDFCDDLVSESVPSGTESPGSLSGRCSPMEQDMDSSTNGSRVASPNFGAPELDASPLHADPHSIDQSEIARRVGNFNEIAQTNGSKFSAKFAEELDDSASLAMDGSVLPPRTGGRSLDGADTADRGSAYFACSLCPKFFMTEPSLKHHNSLYHSEKSFLCEICSKAFRFRSNLAEHRSVHTSLKPYVCKFCGKSSRLKGNLTKHILKHHKKEQTDFIGKDDIIIRKGKKSIKDPAAVDFLEKSMIVLGPDAATPASAHLFSLAKAGDRAAMKRRKGKARNRTVQAVLNGTGRSSVDNDRREGDAVNSENSTCGSHEQSPEGTSHSALTAVNSGSRPSPCLGTERMVSRPDPLLTGMLGQKSSQSSSMPLMAPRIFPALPTAAAALAASSLLPPHHMPFFNFDHLLMALNPNHQHHQIAAAANGAKKLDPAPSFPDPRRVVLEARPLLQSEQRQSSDGGKVSSNFNGQIAGGRENAVGSSHSPTGGYVSSSSMSNTKCETCGKHFRKSTNLAAHLASKHCHADDHQFDRAAQRGLSYDGADHPTQSALSSTPVKTCHHPPLVGKSADHWTPKSASATSNAVGACVGYSAGPNAGSPSAATSDYKNLTKDLRGLKDAVEELKRHSHDDATRYEPLLGSIDARVGRLEHQAEGSLATLYSLVQMQTEMNLGLFQFKADMFEQLRSLQNLIKALLSPSD